ncbi:peptidase inhibitor 16 [Plakobranchus ocellatus]|uniref:Peptidase inhibitor 16 n=1 Tax=Plakobranchus ocellatus TaxID=259542 RepID=A0AAV4D8N8_9GAST|nr:peptidase inhibitor 16 [Plakobranchus ocellatus]
MNTLALTILAGVATLVALAAADITAISDSDRAFLLQKHNDYRTAEPAVTMPNLTWSSSLESSAQAWTDACHYAHQSGQSWGENIAAGTAGSMDNQAAMNLMVDLWTGESQYNTDGSFSCCSSTGNSCCHLTQVVWATTTEVGCGISFCSTLTTSSGSISNAAYLACYYNPPGNKPVATCTFDWSPYEAVTTTTTTAMP